ncbi:ABC transporter ATP-binding protein [Gudongella sp. DL1XJH-153]|uniref:ABC transporter ATP-binding protein n=1 Tax=Gudongella sp. DL1XJH-153 TaxID=3409804 RepID=UPI003BB6BB2D
MYKIENLTKKYNDLFVLDNISMDFIEGGTTCILGPSGCGKTTLLNIISGIESADSGDVIGFDDTELSFVFQEDRLIPWRNVLDNLRFVLSGNDDIADKDKLVESYLDKVGLLEYKNYYPSELSGGMKKRIGILRAFIYPSSILLMDEPLSSIDISNKKVLMDFFRELMDMENRSCILVTHDLEEAIHLGDQIIVLSDKPSKVANVIKNIYAVEPNEENMVKMKKVLEREF